MKPTKEKLNEEKIENFFILYDNSFLNKDEDLNINKSNNDNDNLNLDIITEDKEDSVTNEKNSKLVSLEQFIEMQDFMVSSELIISHSKQFEKGDHLFFDDKYKYEDNCKHRNFKEEGHAVEKNTLKKKYYKKYNLNSVQSVWYSFYEENKINNTKFPNIIEKNEYNTTELVKNVPPVQNNKKAFNLLNIKNYDNQEMKINKILFSFKAINFSYHPLFSIEHALEKLLTKIYSEYMIKRNDDFLMTTQNNLSMLRSKKNNLKDELFKICNNYKKNYKNSDLKKLINSIKKIRMSRIKAVEELQQMERSIVCLWKNIKNVRKLTNITNTDIIVEIKKTNKSIDEDQWNEFIITESIDVVDEKKCDYVERKIKYDNASKSKLSKEKHSKPILEIDEEIIKENLSKELVNVYRFLFEPMILFQIKHLNEIITANPTEINEVKRRKDVKRIRLYLKVYINDKEVFETKKYLLSQDFTIKMNENYGVELNEDLQSIKILIFKKDFFKSILICDLAVPVSKQNSDRQNDTTLHFTNNIKSVFNHNGLGCGQNLYEIITKEFSSLKTSEIENYISKTLNTEGEVLINIDNLLMNDIRQKTSCIDKKNIKIEITLDNLSDMLQSALDPNDPLNSELLTYFKEFSGVNFKSENFYFNSDLFGNFHTCMLLKNKMYTKLVDKEWNKIINICNNELSNKTIKKSNVSTENIINEIDKQREESVKYLQNINKQLSQCIEESCDKKVFDILTETEAMNLKNIFYFLNPKKPLFHQSKLTSPVQTATNRQKEFMLKIHIFKAFHLPNRQDVNIRYSDNDNEESIIKMTSLRPYIHINCQGQSKRTLTAVGTSPTWNEQLCLTVRYNNTSMISIQLFDENAENWLTDDRLEESTVHYHFNTHWLASLNIPLINIINQSKMEGTFLMHCPVELLGYKYMFDEKYSNMHISFDSLKKDTSLKHKDEIFISLYIEIFPNNININNTSCGLYNEKINSNEIDIILRHLINFIENYKIQFPNRQLYLLVIDCYGKNVCITRFFQPITPFDFNECIRKMFSNIEQIEDVGTSKSSTPHKRKNSKINNERDENEQNKVQSILSINTSERKTQSTLTKDMFESKSLNENFLENDEIPLSVKIQMCLRYVSMIPHYKEQSSKFQPVVLLPFQMLKLTCGSMIDHTILLMGYFLQLGIECLCIAGYGLPYGFSTYVLVQHKQIEDEKKNKINIKADKSFFNFKSTSGYFIYDSLTGSKYDVKNPFCPLQRVFYICNNENVWANIQSEDRCNMVKFNISNSSDWRPVFQKNSHISSPIAIAVNMDSVYNYEYDNLKYLRETIEEKIRTKVQKWRKHRKTIWNRYCSKILRDNIIQWEKWCINKLSSKPRHSNQMQQLLISYQVYGFPLNLPYTTINDIVSAVKGTQLHLNEHSSAEFGLGVEVFPYPNQVYSVWIYFVSIIKK